MAVSWILTLNILFLPVFLIFVFFFSVQAKPKKPVRPPTKILDLRIYPIKSCRGISVPYTRLLQTGLDVDRQFMFVDAATNKFMTIREIARMTLITTAFSPDNKWLIVGTPDSEAVIKVPTHPAQAWLDKNTEEIDVEIWGDKTPARAFPASLSQPISDFLGKPVLLVYKGPWTRPRILGGNGDPSLLGREQSLGFADMLPVLVGSLASMAELNSRLRAAGVEEDFSIERFRPNIIVQGDVPWDEDTWKTLRISTADGDGDEKTGRKWRSLILDVPSRCLRCRVPNVNPSTAEEHKKQPWDTLMKYRRIDEGLRFKPVFGMLCAPRDEGFLKVGMNLEVLEVTDKHRFRSSM
jgi:uncharacterized protein